MCLKITLKTFEEEQQTTKNKMASEQPSLLAKDNLAASNPSFSMFDLCLRAKPLGLANGIITDAMIEASSMHDPNHCPSKCRLNFAGSPSFAFQAVRTFLI